MKNIGRLSIFALLLGSLLGLAGCGQDNEDAAEITGVDNPEVSDDSAASYEEYSKQMMKKSQTTYGEEGYPGAQ